MNRIIVPVRNGLHLTRDAVKDFLAQDIGDVDVLVIDNASTDGTTQWLQTQPVSTVPFDPPKSVAASWNFGLRWAFGQGSEYALVVNNDVRLLPATYRLLVEDGGPFVTAVGTDDPSKLKDWTGCTAEIRPHPDHSCYLIRREVYEQVGPFDEQCEVGYVEDARYHLRLHQAGITAYCLDLPFFHLGAGTLKHASPEEAERIRLAADKNRASFKEEFGVEVGSDEYYELFGHGRPPTEAAAEDSSR